MHQAPTKGVIAVRLADLRRDLDLATTFIDTGIDLLSGECLTFYEIDDLRERGLLQLEAYKDHLRRVLVEMEELRASITP